MKKKLSLESKQIIHISYKYLYGLIAILATKLRKNSDAAKFWSSEVNEMLAFILAQSRRGRRELIFIEEGGTRILRGLISKLGIRN